VVTDIAMYINCAVSWDITPYSPVKVKYVSEEHTASIFRIKE
jgi:hypothetical protein